MAIVFFSVQNFQTFVFMCGCSWAGSSEEPHRLKSSQSREKGATTAGPKRSSNIFFPNNTFQSYTELWFHRLLQSENGNQSICQSTSWPQSVSLEVVYVIIPNKSRGALECLGWKASSPTVSVASPSWCVPLLPTLLRADGRSSGPVHPLSKWPPRPKLHLNLRLLFLGFVTWVMP